MTDERCRASRSGRSRAGHWSCRRPARHRVTRQTLLKSLATHQSEFTTARTIDNLRVIRWSGSARPCGRARHTSRRHCLSPPDGFPRQAHIDGRCRSGRCCRSTKAERPTCKSDTWGTPSHLLSTLTIWMVPFFADWALRIRPRDTTPDFFDG